MASKSGGNEKRKLSPSLTSPPTMIDFSAGLNKSSGRIKILPDALSNCKG